MNLLNYNDRIEYIDSLLSKITREKEYKFLILVSLHGMLFVPIYLILLFSQNKLYHLYIILFLLVQLTLNLYDKGCFLMKLERKYIGKGWYGFYTCLNPFIKLNKERTMYLYYSFVVFLCFAVLLKMYLLTKNIDYMSFITSRNIITLD